MVNFHITVMQIKPMHTFFGEMSVVQPIYECSLYTKTIFRLCDQNVSLTILLHSDFTLWGLFPVFYTHTFFQKVCEAVNIRLMVIPHWHKQVEQVTYYNNSQLIR